MIMRLASIAPSFQNDSSASHTCQQLEAGVCLVWLRRAQFWSIQVSNHFLSKSVISMPSGATPWRTLWILRLVMSKIVGWPSGTYLR